MQGHVALKFIPCDGTIGMATTDPIRGAESKPGKSKRPQRGEIDPNGTGLVLGQDGDVVVHVEQDVTFMRTNANNTVKRTDATLRLDGSKSKCRSVCDGVVFGMPTHVVTMQHPPHHTIAHAI